MVDSETEIFIDTSILVYRLLRAQSKRNQVKQQLSGKRVITCSVVLIEYQRLVLKEARYLITLFHQKKSIAEVRDHVTNVLQKPHERKMKICLDILNNLIGDLTQDKQNKRAVQFLHSFIVHGMGYARNIIHQEFDAIECACARHEPIVKKPYKKYEFGPEKCAAVKDECGIAEYLKANRETIINLLAFLATRTGEFTEEMKSIHQFLDKTKDNFDLAPDFNPCLTLGDLLIALESKDVKNFYTANYKESRFFCEFFKQDLIVSNNNPEKADKVYPAACLPWDFS